MVEDYLNTEHDFNTGRHKFAGLNEQSVDPSTVANVGYVYSKDVSGVTELFYRDSAGNVQQITSGGNLLVNSADIASNAVTTAKINASAVTGAKIAANTITGDKIALGSDAQGDVMYYNGTDWVRLAPGTADQVLKTNGAGANPAWANAVTAGTALVQDPFALNSSVAQAHGLGSKPDIVKVEFECKTNDSGWVVGDVIAFNPAGTVSDGAASRGLTFYWDATNLSMITHATNTVTVWHKTSRSAAALTPGSWKLTATPYKFG